MNLDNFEDIIEAKIVDRGFSYYEQDQITELEQVIRGEFCAIVIGTEEYSVYIKLNEEQKVIEHSCDCPYDWGEVCKHEVAVLYYIRDSELYKQRIEKGSIQTITEDLNKLNKNELIEIIVELSKRKRLIRQEVLWELGYEID